MARPKYPITPAIRFLRSNRVEFNPFIYVYADHGGTRQAATELDISEHRVVKTLVMETNEGSPLLVLMHGDQTVSTRNLAREIGAKKVLPVRPEKTVNRTGYRAGGISPFGTRQTMPVYVQATILDLKTIFINGGKRGFLVEIDPAVLPATLSATAVDVAAAPR